jgi:hypothetical protein
MDERNSGETTRFDFGKPVAFQSDAGMGPACAVVDARADGATSSVTKGQKMSQGEMRRRLTATFEPI